MMVTITSMKKIQEPDLLLDQPCHLQNSKHSNSYTTNNLNKTSRSSPRHSHKTRKVHPVQICPDESSICSTTSTNSTIISPFEERPTLPAPLTPSKNKNSRQTTVEGLEDNDPSSQWPESPSPQHQLHHQHVTHSPNTRHINPSPSWVWTRTKTKSPTSSSITSSRDEWRFPGCTVSSSCAKMNLRNLIVLIVVAIILIASVATLLALLLRPSHNSSIDISSGQSKEDTKDSHPLIGDDEMEEYDYNDKSSENSNSNSNNNLDLKEVSRLSWNLLNSNQERSSSGNNRNRDSSSSSSISNSNSGNRNRHHPPSSLIPSSFSSISGGEEVILPSKMIFTSKGNDPGDGKNFGSNPTGENSNSKGNKERSCCRTQKYSQVIKRDGCEPLTITNRMCFGQCVSVWVPGLFASFPVCRPSRSSWKTVTLVCGKNHDRKRRVRIEKVRRCSCMEIEPTAPSPTSNR